MSDRQTAPSTIELAETADQAGREPKPATANWVTRLNTARLRRAC